jgi:hypothetical protein
MPDSQPYKSLKLNEFCCEVGKAGIKLLHTKWNKAGKAGVNEAY